MSLLDKISDLAGKFAPSKSSNLMGGGIGSGHGMVPLDDDVSDWIMLYQSHPPLYTDGRQRECR